MASLETRVAHLEGAQANANLETMTDDELKAYIATLESGSSRWWDAILTNIMRHPSALQIVKDDPAHAVANIGNEYTGMYADNKPVQSFNVR